MRGSSRRAGPAALSLLLTCAAFAGFAASAAQSTSLRPFLPAGADVPGWPKDGEPQEFEGEDLYTYINGGAEIYQEYGFRRVIVQDYEKAGGRSISLEIFEMETPAAAFGMFTFKRSGQGQSVDLGGGGELESYYLNFWKGRFLATLTGFDDSRETVEGLTRFARGVEAKLPGGGEGEPALAAALPREGLDPRSVKYIKGLLGLNNIYPFMTTRGLAFQEAVRGLYDSGESLILIEYGATESRRAAWIELRSGLERSGRFEQPTNYLADAVVFKDGKGRYLAFGEAGSRLAVGIHSTLDWALATVARARCRDRGGRPPYCRTCLTISTRPRAYSISVRGIFFASAILVKRPSLLLSLVTTM